MEFPQLGEHCSWSQCKTLDFLPFICTHCQQVFCKIHLNPDSHECKLFIMSTTASQTSSSSTYFCFFNDCNERSPLQMLCPKCSKHFCLSHRYHDCFDVKSDEEEKKLWKETQEKFTECVQAVEKTVNENLKKAMMNPKKAETAKKIQLMKLKAKASGDSTIPLISRIYFLILQPKTSKGKSKALFVNKDWSLGKVIDSISNLCNLPNKNNQMNCPKLKLFKLDGTQVFSDTSAKIFELINSERIINGDNLILEYVDPNEDSPDFILKDCLMYSENL